MAEELISHYIDRAAFKSDTDFAIADLTRFEEIFKVLRDGRLNLAGTLGLKDVAAVSASATEGVEQFANEVKKLTASISQNTQATAANSQTRAKSKEGMTEVEKAAEKLAAALSKENEEIQGFRAQTAEANKAAKEMAKEQLGLTNQYEKSVKRLNELKRELKDMAIQGQQSTSRFHELSAEFNTLNDSIRGAEQGVGEFQRNVGNYSGAVSVLKTSLDEVSARLEKFKTEGTASADIIERLEREYEVLNHLVNSQEAGFANATQEIRANQRALLDLEQAGLAGTDAYNQLAQATGDLVDQVGDLRERTRNLGSDTFVFDGLIGAAEGLAGAYGAAQAATELFGANTEEFTKILTKLQAVQTLLASLQAIRNTLQAQSSTLLLAERVRTQGLAIAQGVYTVAVGASTGAMRVFRTVLLASGIGVVIGLLALAADAMGLFDDSVDETTKSLEDQNAALEKNRESLQKVIDASDKERNSRKGGLNDLKRELELAEARGDNEKKIFELKKEIYDKEELNRRIAFESFHNDRDKQIEIAEDQKNKQNAFEAEKLAAARKANDESVKSAEDASKKRTKANEEEAQRLSELRERDVKAYFDINTLRINDQIKYYEAIASNDQANSSERATALINQTELELKLLKAKADFELRNDKLTGNERQLIQEQLNSDTIASAIAFQGKMKAINDKRIQDEKDAAENKTVGSIDEFKNDTPTFQDEVANRIAADKAISDSAKETAKKRAEIEKQLQDKLKELGFEGIDTVQTFIDASFDTKKNKIQDEIDAIDAQKAADIERINATTLSEQDKAAKLTQIEIKAQSDKEALQKRQRELDQKKAAFDKAIAIAKIVANTAIAITGFLAEQNYAFAIIAGAVGALQVAQVLATPIPKFRHGKTDSYEGPAIVGDGGVPEFIRRADGTIERTPSKDTLTYLGSKDIVYPDAMAMMKALAMPDINVMPERISEMQMSRKIDETNSELRSLKAAIIGKQEVHFSWSNGQLQKAIKNGESWTEYVNRVT